MSPAAVGTLERDGLILHPPVMQVQVAAGAASLPSAAEAAALRTTWQFAGDWAYLVLLTAGRKSARAVGFHRTQDRATLDGLLGTGWVGLTFGASAPTVFVQPNLDALRAYLGMEE